MRFAKGRGVLDVGVTEVLFCQVRFQAGNSLVKYEKRCCCARVWPGVPGTRGMSSGERRELSFAERVLLGEGRARRKASDKGL